MNQADAVTQLDVTSRGRCSVPDCISPAPGAMCSGHWFALPWALRNEAGTAWKVPETVTPGWLRDALSVLLPDDERSRPAREALSWKEQAYREAHPSLSWGERMLQEGRPKTRAECRGGMRPCPWVSCASHLYVTVTEDGTLQFNHPGKSLDELDETCAEDVIERGGCSAARAGELVGIRRGRVGQMERKFRAMLAAEGVCP